MSADTLHRLADAQPRELVFLEVGIDPHGFHRQDGEHLGRGAHLLAELHGAAHHVAGDRCHDARAGCGQPRRAQLRLRLQHARMRLGSGAGDRGARGRQRRLRLRQPRLRRVHRVLLVLQGLLRDAVQGDQRPVALDVLVRLGHLHVLGLQRGRVALRLGEQLRHVTHRLGETGLGLGERHLRIARIELHQHLAAVHELRLVGV